MKKDLDKCDGLAFSFAPCGMFKDDQGGEKGLLLQHFPNMKFVRFHVEKSVLMKRFEARNEVIVKQSGMSIEEWWKLDDFKEYRAQVGEEFSMDKIYAFWEAMFFNEKMIDVDNSKDNEFVIDNEDFESQSGIKELNKILGLEWEEINTDKIAQINYERYELMGFSQGDKQLVWMAGMPGTGKTFFGDYMQTRGWHHIDGDMGNRTKDEEVKAAFMKLAGGMMALQKGGVPDGEHWKPYYSHLIKTVKEAFKTHKKVVLTFAMLGCLGNDIAFIEEAFPIMKFVVVEVN
jgi:hypothetical protein